MVSMIYKGIFGPHEGFQTLKKSLVTSLLKMYSGRFRGGKGGANAPPFLPSSLVEAYVV